MTANPFDDETPFVRPEWDDEGAGGEGSKDGWRGPSGDPNDRQFGDVIEPIDPEAADETDAVLVGEPYDGAVIGRRGARYAPTAIRRSLAGVKTAHLRRGDPSDQSGVRIGDLGDIRALEGDGLDSDGVDGVSGDDDGDNDHSGQDVASVQKHVKRIARRVHDLETLPVFIGGDNSLTYGNVAPLLESGDDRVGVVNLDAHLDCREVRESPTSGTPYRQLLSDGLDTYVAVGARHFETSSAYVDYVEDRGGTIVPADAFGAGLEAVVDAVRSAVADVDTLYVSVDCDVLDAAAAPGVSAPTPGGLTTRELFGFVGSIAADGRLAGLEVVECSPPRDEGNRTVDAAARTIAYALWGYLEENR
ncbi:formimidoylglutamase [Natronoglomus mannanivorans]|uniref:Formimidoylglutamase n=1 Tax=Natronoglomus mannanivorans TaxID=2979990 RepID=A0AAP3E3I0_9EURY|nr:formimidoylglutamase [Halobacteria archaeon AArc-xg1-1]